MNSLVLLVDDDAALRSAWRRLLKGVGFEVLEAPDAAVARQLFKAHPVHLVLLDLMLPPEQTPEAGAALLGEFLSARPDAKVVVVSGTGEASLALSLVQRGAYDFFSKPADPEHLLAVLGRAQARMALESRVRELEQSLAAREDQLLGQAPSFLEAKQLAARAAVTDIPILLTGASGSGKEVFARFVHAHSRRADKPFVTLNCGAISPQLLESTLFGHKKGAFTGATADSKGLFAEAHGGTLFLDEIGDLQLDLQVKLLRATESGEVLPVGASRPVQVDVRLVSATHQPLPEQVANKHFREDLYWRLRGIEVALPRLAERPGDVVLLAQHFLNTARSLVPHSVTPALSPATVRCLESYDWPGNLRELRHEMQRALVLSGGRGEIQPEDLSPALRAKAPTEGTDRAALTLEEKIERLEREELTRALAECEGNRSHAAEKLGLSRQGLLNKMARYGLR
ncbi:sigma-54-dependent transcriptional regulator [Stigmatella aurantiaca]|uniref:Two component, sigma54 specific, transcriptional regulator, Fis family n=1 Tax=Stigmatella aurantiaca (strain DW4/3-1) TaxID=378806 RepID=Q099N2_STIAD|nr:sigma-54 dependent transcriptional regulator [Stigmatella aurantiaca]EAU68484.1 two component, sigma54 specific, transcriptional regulator, Fis family [Stigmatella aurantiaca DW4/3-1]